MDPLVEIKNLNLIYDIGTPRETHALKDVNLEIYQEEYVIFYGPSGCGKSTLLYCISGLLTPTAGEVRILGEDIVSFSTKKMADFHRKTMSIVFQAYNLIPTLSVVDNVALPQIWRGVPASQRERSAARLLDELGLAHVAKRIPQELSGGQQQRVAIARSLVNDPPLILGDEPVGNLDSKSARDVLEIFSKLNMMRKKTVIVVTHDSSLFSYADRIVFIRDGRIVKEEKNANKEMALATPQAESRAAIKEQENEERRRRREFTDALSDYTLTVSEVYLKEKMDETVLNYLEGRWAAGELRKNMTAPLRDGGLGFSAERADDLIKRVEVMIFESNLLKKKTDRDFRYKPLPLEIGELRRFLLSDFSRPLGFQQIKSLDEAIGGRLRGSINNDAFLKVIGLPESVGGVGLSGADAFHFLFKLKMIMKLR